MRKKDKGKHSFYNVRKAVPAPVPLVAILDWNVIVQKKDPRVEAIVSSPDSCRAMEESFPVFKTQASKRVGARLGRGAGKNDFWVKHPSSKTKKNGRAIGPAAGRGRKAKTLLAVRLVRGTPRQTPTGVREG